MQIRGRCFLPNGAVELTFQTNDNGIENLPLASKFGQMLPKLAHTSLGLGRLCQGVVPEMQGRNYQ